MGNTFTKPDYRNYTIDGGQAQIKESRRQPSILTPPQRSGTVDPNEYDPLIVGKVIMRKKLAPFYDGKFDERNVSDGRSARSGSILTTESARRSRSQQHLQQPSNHNTKTKKEKKKKKNEPNVVTSAWLNSNLLECPICLLWYPKNINYTKCCKKPICTLCFVSIKRPVSATRLISCPFCRATSLTVIYRSPEKVKEMLY